MPLNEKDEPCEEVFEYEDVSTKRVVVGTRKIKRGRGYQDVPEFNEIPIKKKIRKLIPAEQRGWGKKISWETPRRDRSGRIDLVQYTINYIHHACPRCKTNDYVRLKLVGWDFHKHRYLQHKGTGPVLKCFKCGFTEKMSYGKLESPTKKEKGVVVKTSVTIEEARQAVLKYGVEPEFPKNEIGL